MDTEQERDIRTYADGLIKEKRDRAVALSYAIDRARKLARCGDRAGHEAWLTVARAIAGRSPEHLPLRPGPDRSLVLERVTRDRPRHLQPRPAS